MRRPIKPLHGFRTVMTGFLIVLVLVCVMTCSFFTILPVVDRAACYHRLAKDFGVAASYDELQNLIRESLNTGMTRTEAKSVLERFGSVSVIPGKKIFNNQITDQIGLKMCLHPFNNMVIYLHYDLDEKLVSVEFEPQDN